MPQDSDLLGVTGQLIGCLQDHRLVLKKRMVHNTPERVQTQVPLSEAFMAVLVAGIGILGVV